MTAAVTTALDELSHLLGVPVAGVSRTAPAHKDGNWVMTGAGMRFNPASATFDGVEQVRRETWFIRLEDGRYLRVESRDVRKAREFSALLRRYRSRATLNNRMCRKALKLMHEVMEREAG